VRDLGKAGNWPGLSAENNGLVFLSVKRTCLSAQGERENGLQSCLDRHSLRRSRGSLPQKSTPWTGERGNTFQLSLAVTEKCTFTALTYFLQICDNFDKVLRLKKSSGFFFFFQSGVFQIIFFFKFREMLRYQIELSEVKKTSRNLN